MSWTLRARSGRVSRLPQGLFQGSRGSDRTAEEYEQAAASQECAAADTGPPHPARRG